jgi:hypothetical protein
MKKKDLLLELSMPTVMAALAVFFLVKAASIKPKSAGIFPTICAVLLLIGVAITVIQIFAVQEKTTRFEGLRVEKALLLLLILVLYAVVLLPNIGYIISTLLLCASVMLLLGYRNLPVVGICSVVAVALIFVLFKVILKVPLPMIFLDF